MRTDQLLPPPPTQVVSSLMYDFTDIALPKMPLAAPLTVDMKRMALTHISPKFADTWRHVSQDKVLLPEVKWAMRIVPGSHEEPGLCRAALH